MMLSEQYIVKLNYQKPDGYWVVGHEEEVSVLVNHKMQEKNNHDAAEVLAKLKFPGCHIVSISYI